MHVKPVADEDRRRDDQPGADAGRRKGYSPQDPAVAEHDNNGGDVFPPVPASDPSLQASRSLPNFFNGHRMLAGWL
jgi:hypothetical protein